MNYEFEQVTTRGGDGGESSLYNGTRLPKNDLVFETLGDLDELNCALGGLRVLLKERRGDDFDPHMPAESLRDTQQAVMRLSSQVATPAEDPLYATFEEVGAADLELLEARQRDLMGSVVIPECFAVPGDGTPEGAAADVARALCRRCERKLAALVRTKDAAHLKGGLAYLNRLSDYLFVVARFLDD